jgi:hypothetical protein
VHHAVFGQPKRHNGGQYGKPGKNKRKNDIKAYVKAGLFHDMLSDKFVQTMLIMVQRKGRVVNPPNA